MAENKAMIALFKLCTEFRKEIDTLRAEIKELRDARTAPEKMLESMNDLSEDIMNAGDYAETEVFWLDTELSKVRKHVEEYEKGRAVDIQKIRALETRVFRGQANSVRQIPERDQPKAKTIQKTRPIQKTLGKNLLQLSQARAYSYVLPQTQPQKGKSQ